MPQFPSNNTWKPTWTTVQPVTAVAGATTNALSVALPVSGRFIDGYLLNNNAAIPAGDSWQVTVGAVTHIGGVAPAANVAAKGILRATVQESATSRAFLPAGTTVVISTTAAGGSTFTGGLLCLVFEQE